MYKTSVYRLLPIPSMRPSYKAHQQKQRCRHGAVLWWPHYRGSNTAPVTRTHPERFKSLWHKRIVYRVLGIVKHPLLSISMTLDTLAHQSTLHHKRCAHVAPNLSTPLHPTPAATPPSHLFFHCAAPTRLFIPPSFSIFQPVFFEAILAGPVVLLHCPWTETHTTGTIALLTIAAIAAHRTSSVM